MLVFNEGGYFTISNKKEKRIPGDFKDKRWCHLHYHIEEIAEIMNISLNKLRLICSTEKIRLDTLTFKELVSFVQKYKGKKKLRATSPETTKCPP